MRANLRAAIQGAIVGSTLGAPLRGQANTKRLSFYEPIPTRMAPSDSLDAWLVWSRHLESGGNPEGLADAYFNSSSANYGETGFARAHFALGILPPLCGRYQNPLAYGSESIGRSLFWGIRFHGQPDLASEWAYFDACIDHGHEATLISVAIARAFSLLKPGVAPSESVRAMLTVLPSNSLGHRAIHSTLQLLNRDLAPADFKLALAQELGLTDGQHSAMSLGAVAFALLRGRGDFGDSVTLAAGFGGASDGIASVVGAISGFLAGEVPQDWLAPLTSDFISSFGLRTESVTTRQQFEDVVLGPEEVVADVLVEAAKVEVEAPAAAAIEPTLADEQPTPEPERTSLADALPEGRTVETSLQPPSDSLKRLLADKSHRMIARAGDVRITCEFPSGPTFEPEQVNEIVLHFSNLAKEEAVVEPTLTSPSDWVLKHRLTSFRLKAGESNAFAAVLKPPAAITKPEQLGISLGETNIKIALPTTQRWYTVGPLPNIEGTGWDKAYPCESVRNTKEVFNGRSNLAVRWKAQQFPDVEFTLEPMFLDGPGIVYLWTKLRFNESPARLVCAASSGAIVWINSLTVVRYHDVHQPVPRAILPYLAEIDAGQEFDILIKVVRNKVPIEPVILYFIGRGGDVLLPQSFGEMSG